MLSGLLEKFDHIVGGHDASPAAETQREWDRLRDNAMSSAERTEIDAIFARQIDSI